MARAARADTLPEISGKVARTYRVQTIEKIDDNLRGLGVWLAEQITKAPEFGIGYVRRWRHDVDALLDARIILMSRRDAARGTSRATPGPPPPAELPG